MKWVEFLVQVISWKIKYHKSYPIYISFNHLVSHVTFTFYCPPTYGNTLELPLMWSFFSISNYWYYWHFFWDHGIYIYSIFLFWKFGQFFQISSYFLIYKKKSNLFLVWQLSLKKCSLIYVLSISKNCFFGLALRFVLFYIIFKKFVYSLLVLYNGFWECVCVCVCVNFDNINQYYIQ
jgi:hypothetical protein